MSVTGMTLVAAWLLRADPARARALLREEWKWVILPSGLALAGALLIAAAIIATLSRWRRANRSESTTASEQLSEFRSLYEKGQMSREEFERIRAHLSDQIRGPAPASPAATTAPTPGVTAPEESVTPGPPPTEPTPEARPPDTTTPDQRPPA